MEADMTASDRFGREEWLLLADAPLAAAAAVALVEDGGGRREAAALIAGWREGGRMFANSALIATLIAEFDPEDREQPASDGDTVSLGQPSVDTIIDEAVALCGRAVQLLTARATLAETEEYKRFVMHIAQRVAQADNESGFLGLGGEPVSRAERGVLRELAMALGYQRPDPPATEH
jgi:hypothetical protein